MKKTILLFVCAAVMLSTRAGLPEPGARLYGTIALNGIVVTAADSAIVIEARRTPAGPPIASYRMGSRTNAGNFYSLQVNAEATTPVSGSNNVVLGAVLYLVVRNDTTDLEQKPFTLAGRGLSARVDFGEVDTDGDGMSDAFEQLYFGSATGGNPNADSDGDGRPNLREFLQGTNPNVADGRHPADLAPADDRLTLKEVTDYILAWKTGGTWPIEPALNSPNIEDYVTRAGAIWKGGEVYVFDNDPVTVAPLWWKNPDVASLAAQSKKETNAAPAVLLPLKVERTVAQVYRSDLAVPVTLWVKPSDKTRAFAVVETPPPGWTVRNLSHEGRWDAANRKIKWGPFFDQTPRTLSYEAVPAPTSSGSAEFAGRGSFDGVGQAADGPNRMWTVGQTPAPTLTARPVAAGMVVELQGEAGRNYEVLTSPDLVTWTVGEAVTLDSQGRFNLQLNGAEAARFLRIRSVE